MKIYDVDYHTGKLSLIGTIRIVDDKLVFDLSERDYGMIVGNAPIDEIDPAEFISYLKGRFAMQTGIATEDEPEYDYDDLKTRLQKKGAKFVEVPMSLLKEYPYGPIPEDKIFYSEKGTKKKKI